MDIHLINRRLQDTYGMDFLSQPFYRVVWSDEEIEKRFSEFEDYVPGTNILLRRVKEVREVKKYSYLQPQYILEKLFFNQHNKEILDNKTLAPRSCTYEPVWSFGFEKNGRARQPIWRAIELILISVNNPKRLTPSEMSDADFEQAVKDEKLMMDLMEQYIPNDSLHSSVQDGDTVMFGRSTSEVKEK